jgi:hypothetical protein
MANANDILNVGHGTGESIVAVCSRKLRTDDSDVHDDLVEGWPCPSGPCINEKRQNGKVFIPRISRVIKTAVAGDFQWDCGYLKAALAGLTVKLIGRV